MVTEKRSNPPHWYETTCSPAKRKARIAVMVGSVLASLAASVWLLYNHPDFFLGVLIGYAIIQFFLWVLEDDCEER